MVKKPAIVITGASGFVGRNLIGYLIKDYTVFAIARRSRKQADIPSYPNLHWLQCDISNMSSLLDAADYINKNGGADFIIHLAAYYDFTYKNNEAYRLINIEGTKNILDLAFRLDIKRFIFASSIAACKFKSGRETITEKTPPDGEFNYALSKKVGEELVREYSRYFSCSVIRLAAVFSDWCEYPPLYKFLECWLSKKYDARFIGGKGLSAVPYIHIRDICQMIEIILTKSDILPEFDIYLASPNGSLSHKILYDISTRYFFGKPVKPFFVPKYLAYPGLLVKHILKFLSFATDEIFEQFWMIGYIDQKLNVNSNYTQLMLNWKPTPRYHLSRRIMFMLEKMKSHPHEWLVRNEASLKRFAKRTNLIIYDEMIEIRKNVLALVSRKILKENPGGIFTPYQKLPSKDFQCFMSVLYHLLLATIRNGDRSLMLSYIDEIAISKINEGYDPKVLCETLKVFSRIIADQLLHNKQTRHHKQEIYDNITLPLQLARDEIEDVYENLGDKLPLVDIPLISVKVECPELLEKIRRLCEFYNVAEETKDGFTETNKCAVQKFRDKNLNNPPVKHRDRRPSVTL